MTHWNDWGTACLARSDSRCSAKMGIAMKPRESLCRFSASRKPSRPRTSSGWGEGGPDTIADTGEWPPYQWPPNPDEPHGIPALPGLGSPYEILPPDYDPRAVEYVYPPLKYGGPFSRDDAIPHPPINVYGRRCIKGKVKFSPTTSDMPSNCGACYEGEPRCPYHLRGGELIVWLTPPHCTDYIQALDRCIIESVVREGRGSKVALTRQPCTIRGWFSVTQGSRCCVSLTPDGRTRGWAIPECVES